MKSKLTRENLSKLATLADNTAIVGGNPPHSLTWAEVLYSALGGPHPDDRGVSPDLLEERAAFGETILESKEEVLLSPEQLVMIRKHVANLYSPAVLRRFSKLVESE